MSELSPPLPSDDQQVIRSSELWHRDGSVVLQAGRTQFRVHWSVLSLDSSFFRDIEALPQPPDEIKVDGCHLIVLADDTAGDLEIVLKALYNPLFSSEKPLPLSVVASHMRISRKYDFREILQTMVDRLSYENPKSLAAYALLIENNRYRAAWIQSYKGFHFDLLTLVKETNMYAVLPCAYYRVIIFHSQSELFDGVERADGTRAMLSPSDQRLCNLARTQIIQCQWELGNTFGWVRSRPPQCIDPVPCSQRNTARDGGRWNVSSLQGGCQGADGSWAAEDVGISAIFLWASSVGTGQT
ncbi:hypothetical protein FB45DRAFT_1050067 [Roridomyces roridus]|uniref:BTB domain-containing protein n=1 Tax=Roridomyces roridus TaxID=1738132 RepID=A0AAD7CIR4_9AGAR|nr:hypothetical protein FB45DRAFT_1050067 [Roridomyces roridus]